MKQVVAYLNFDGNCKQAMEFYAKCLGAELEMMPFSVAPGNPSSETADRIMHARLSKGPLDLLMASDIQPGMPFLQGNNISASVHCESLAEIENVFAALSEKGKVNQPLQDTFWGARFGMLTDQFGIHWMFNFAQAQQASAS
jgi:PhnB protein